MFQLEGSLHESSLQKREELYFLLVSQIYVLMLISEASPNYMKTDTEPLMKY